MATSVPDHGPFLSGSVGPNSETMGVPTADAICNGPVSPEIISDAPRQSSTTSARRVGGATRADPADASATTVASASSPGPHSTNGTYPLTSRRNAATSPKCSGIHRLFGQAAP